MGFLKNAEVVARTEGNQERIKQIYQFSGMTKARIFRERASSFMALLFMKLIGALDMSLIPYYHDMNSA